MRTIWQYDGMAKAQLRGRLNATWGKEKEKAGPKIQISSLSSDLEHRYMLQFPGKIWITKFLWASFTLCPHPAFALPCLHQQEAPLWAWSCTRFLPLYKFWHKKVEFSHNRCHVKKKKKKGYWFASYWGIMHHYGHLRNISIKLLSCVHYLVNYSLF